jgi:class 3 adenylate cyclase
MPEQGQTQFARNGDVHLAYQTVGSGPIDILLVEGADLGGLAVHIGARVAAAAQPGEVLVSSTVKDLLAGSSVAFEDRGEQELKGVPGEWRLFAASD